MEIWKLAIISFSVSVVLLTVWLLVTGQPGSELTTEQIIACHFNGSLPGC